jgi:hypothetical protein
LTPFLARSVGFLPVFFPPEGRLGHAAVHAQPGPVDAFPVVVGQQARLPHLLEDTRRDPLLEAIVGGGTRAKASSVEGLPLAAGAEDEEDGVHAHAVGSTRPAAAEAMGVLVFGKQQGDALPQVVWDMPLVHSGHIHKNGVFHGCTSSMQLPEEMSAVYSNYSLSGVIRIGSKYPAPFKNIPVRCCFLRSSASMSVL